MSSAALLDTRTPYDRNRSSSTHLNKVASGSQTGSPGLTFFRRAIHDLLRSGHRERAACRKNVSDRLMASRDPVAYINELIEECVIKGGSEGLDIGIDVLSGFGGLVFQYASGFWRKDVVNRWGGNQDPHRHHMNDDVWYVLLRAAATSDMDPWQKFQMLSYCGTDGPTGVREAAVHALGDLGGDDAVRFLRHMRDSDSSLMVREVATEVLGDLEG